MEHIAIRVELSNARTMMFLPATAITRMMILTVERLVELLTELMRNIDWTL